jgi:hypothetical protein
LAIPSDKLMREYGYFHSNSKMLTKEGQYVFESPLLAGHVMLMRDVLAQEIPYFPDQAALDAFLTNPATSGILKKYDQVSLTELKSPLSGMPVTDQQTWYIEDEGAWMKPIVLGAMAADTGTNTPSDVLNPRLYRQDGTEIPATLGVWWVDAFQGLLRFGEGYEPNKASAYGGTAIGTPKITCYVYTGKKLTEMLSEEVQNRDFVYVSSEPSLVHDITHNLGSMSIKTTVFEPTLGGGWIEVLTNPEHLTDNTSRIELVESVNIKAVLRKIG